MNQDSRVLDLVVTWEELRSAGCDLSPETLCRNCPELLDEVRVNLEAMAGIDAVLASAAPPIVSPPTAPPRWHAALPKIPNYEILEELGRGGMGVVYKARHVPLDRIVALKTMRAYGAIEEEQLRRFLQEAKAMALLQHPNIVQIYEVGQQADQPFLAMEYVPGTSLAATLAGKPWPARKAAALVATLARAIQLAHEHGILHRDLKPTNILLTADGTPKICDFGLAKQLEGDPHHTRTDELLGTPSYMAPEQVRRTPDSQRPTVDVHALGAILYETLTGRPPYLADNPLDTLQRVLIEDPLPPRRLQPKLSRDLETICLKCLAKSPSQRYATAAELADDLERFLAHERVHARPIGPLGRCQRWCRSHPSQAILVLTAAVTVGLILTLMATYNHRLGQELARTDAAQRETLAAEEQLQRTLLKEVAERIDGDLRQLASIPQTLAALLEQGQAWNEPLLEKSLSGVLDKTPRVFGLCVAFEPYQWQPDRENFALYVYRGKQSVAVKQLLPPEYQPLYRQWQWYRVASDSPQGRWSEPYIDAGGGQVPMVTFSAPIHRNGQLVGVVAADLAMDYFYELRSSLDRLDATPGSYCFLVSSGQQILVHPVDRYEFPSPIRTFLACRRMPVSGLSPIAGIARQAELAARSTSRLRIPPGSSSVACRRPTGRWST